MYGSWEYSRTKVCKVANAKVKLHKMSVKCPLIQLHGYIYNYIAACYVVIKNRSTNFYCCLWLIIEWILLSLTHKLIIVITSLSNKKTIIMIWFGWGSCNRRKRDQILFSAIWKYKGLKKSIASTKQQ